MHGLPLRDSDDAVLGTWIEFPIQRHGERTYSNTFCTRLEVTADNVAASARLGRARWKIENETFNCLARHGYNSKRNFGHGRHGLANLLATLNLFAFALHTLLDGLQGVWRQCRDEAGPRRRGPALLDEVPELDELAHHDAGRRRVAGRPLAREIAAAASGEPGPSGSPQQGSAAWASERLERRSEPLPEPLATADAPLALSQSLCDAPERPARCQRPPISQVLRIADSKLYR